jgi:hypothetical protein
MLPDTKTRMPKRQMKTWLILNPDLPHFLSSASASDLQKRSLVKERAGIGYNVYLPVDARR